jgi:hypothetical protein
MQRTGPSKAASLAAAAMALLLATPAAVMAEPRALSASEMDGVTAGRIRVDAVAFAQASGDFALARSRGDALVVTMDERELGVGFAEGLAFACCARESAVVVHSSVSSTGQVVHSDSHAVTFRGAIADRDGQVRHFTYGYAAAFLVARSPGEWPDAGAQAGHEPWDHLGQSVSGLIDVGQMRRQGAVSGFAFAPMLAVGVRWRLFRNFQAARPTGPASSMASLRPSPAPSLHADRTPFGVLP